ncbi:MAG: helix-turn-helix domain-containing protein [Oscillospiraceae bacterium]
MITYKKALDLLKSKGYTTYIIRQDNLLPQSTLTKMVNNGYISTATIDKLCNLLDCQPGDLIEYVPDK